MDDTTFDFRHSDVAAGSARFPGRRHPDTDHTTSIDAVKELREHGSHFARHAWDESGHL